MGELRLMCMCFNEGYVLMATSSVFHFSLLNGPSDTRSRWESYLDLHPELETA